MFINIFSDVHALKLFMVLVMFIKNISEHQRGVGAYFCVVRPSERK